MRDLTKMGVRGRVRVERIARKQRRSDAREGGYGGPVDGEGPDGPHVMHADNARDTELDLSRGWRVIVA